MSIDLMFALAAVFAPAALVARYALHAPLAATTPVRDLETVDPALLQRRAARVAARRGTVRA